MNLETRPRSFYLLAGFFVLFVLFLYGPMFSIVLLSFQGPQGGLTFPMNGVSLHWFAKLYQGIGVVDIGGAFRRSLELGAVVMVLTVVFSLSAGLAFRKKLAGSGVLFYVVVSSLIMPSIVVSLGIALEFRLLDTAILAVGHWMGYPMDNFTTSLGLFTSALGAQLTWTLPFGLLIMLAVFNRFDPTYEEAAQDLGATAAQTLRYVVLPITAPSLVGIALFGFTLSYDELARTSQVAGSLNTLPLELEGLTTTVTTPVVYALGTLTTGLSLLVIAVSLVMVWWLRRRQARHGSDAGIGV